MNKAIYIETGDVLMIKDGKSLIAKGIMYFMRLYKKRKNITNIPENYHHVARVIDLWGMPHIAEANQPGFQIQKPNDAYSDYDWLHRIDIYRPIKPYTEEEKRLLSKQAVYYSTKVNRYDFMNFIYQVKLILTGIWSGPTGDKATKRFYCSEAAATLENDIRPNSFKLPAAVNPVDVVASGLYYKVNF